MHEDADLHNIFLWPLGCFILCFSVCIIFFMRLCETRRALPIKMESVHSSCCYSDVVQPFACCSESKITCNSLDPLLAERNWKRWCWCAGTAQILCCSEIIAANVVFVHRSAEMLCGWEEDRDGTGRHGGQMRSLTAHRRQGINTKLN